jgi:hypothetical protein
MDENCNSVYQQQKEEMSKHDVRHGGDDEYFRGQTDTSIRVLFDDIKEIKNRLTVIDNKLDENIEWKNKMMGISAAIAFIITLLSNKLFAAIFGV